MKIIARTGIVLLLIAAVAGGLGYYFVFYPNIRVEGEGVFYIREDDSFENVMENLQNDGYIKNSYTLRFVSRLKKYPDMVKSGRYRLKDGMNNNTLVNLLRSGNQEAVHFTFNNLRTLEQLAGVVSRQLEIDSLEFLETARRPDLQRELGFTPETFIGMFIPNTYQVYWNTKPEKLIRKMAEEYRKFWNDTRLAEAKKAGLSPMEVMTLASIIEEETIRPEEYPVIAGVYINRLNKNIPLSACPTLKFALGDFTLKRILNKHLEIESPYNTYKNLGLPPGPIRMASVNVIDAVLHYKKHDYLYFCAKSDFSGGHYFSKTLHQHNIYAEQYHRALNQRKIY